VVTVDQGVTSTGAYQLYNNQVKYAQLGADWLFKQIGSKGKRGRDARHQRRFRRR